MAGSVGRSFRFMGLSWRLLGDDPRLLLLPVGSFLMMGLATWAFFKLGLLDLFGDGSHVGGYVGLYGLYAVIAFIGICFNATLIAVALKRLSGEPATIADGWAMVRSRMPAVIRWALLAATVGVVLRAVEERTGVLGRVVGFFGGIAWGLLTFFVVPVLLLEPVEVRGALRRSSALFRERWGEQLTANLAIGTGFLVVWLPMALVSLFVAISISIGAGMVVFVASFLIVLAFATALTDVFNAALYRYATEGHVPDGFSAEDFDRAIKVRRRRRRGAQLPDRPDA